MSDGRAGDLDRAHNERWQPCHSPSPQGSIQSPKQQQAGGAETTVDSVAKKGKKSQNSLSERAATASKAVNIIQRVNLCDLTPATWNFMQQNLDSVLTYIKDIKEEREKTRENTEINPNSSYTKGVAKTWAAMATQVPTMKLATKEKDSIGGKKLKELVRKIEDKKEREQSRTMLAEQILQKV